MQSKRHLFAVALITNPKTVTLSLSLSHHFNSHFSGEPGLAGFIEAKGDGSGGDYRSNKTYKAPDKSSPPSNQHPMFYRPDALLSRNQQCQSTEGSNPRNCD